MTFFNSEAFIIAITGLAIVITLAGIAKVLLEISGWLKGILHFTHIIAEARKYDEEDRDLG